MLQFLFAEYEELEENFDRMFFGGRREICFQDFIKQRREFLRNIFQGTEKIFKLQENLGLQNSSCTGNV